MKNLFLRLCRIKGEESMKEIIKWMSFIVMMFSILFNTIDASLIKKAKIPFAF